MVKNPGIREKLRSGSLKELARERIIMKSKRSTDAKLAQANVRHDDDSDSDSDDSGNRSNLREDKADKKNSLLSILPKPKNSSAFGPTIDLEKLLKMPERAVDKRREDPTIDQHIRTLEDGTLEIDVRRVVGDPVYDSIPKFKEEVREKVVVPRGKEKQKNQITYLAQLGKAYEIERKEQASLGRLNKAQARAKYGW